MNSWDGVKQEICIVNVQLANLLCDASMSIWIEISEKMLTLIYVAKNLIVPTYKVAGEGITN